MSPSSKNTARKFTFDTEFLGAESRPAPAAHARQKKTLTNEELDNLQAAARSEGENNSQARAAEALERTIAALTIGSTYAQAEVQALRAACEQLGDDVRALVAGLKTSGTIA